MSHKIISPAEASTAVSNGQGILLDVRTPKEFREVHASGALLVPLDVLNRESVDNIRGAQTGSIYLLCASGIRAVKAAEKLQSAGIVDLHVVKGGTNAWVGDGLPVIRGQKTISIERQVRIGAGSLVLIGTILGWFVNRYFTLLAGFVGAGLVFAGITDICGLAILLAKAPWNRSGKDFRNSPP